MAQIITFDGTDGAGKSTFIKRLTDLIINHTNKDVVVINHPGGTPIGEELRTILLHRNDKVSTVSELACMLSSRSEIKRKIQNEANDNHIILIDRWDMSTLFYQSCSMLRGNDVVDYGPALMLTQKALDTATEIDNFQGIDEFEYKKVQLHVSIETSLRRASPEKGDYFEKNIVHRTRVHGLYEKAFEQDDTESLKILNDSDEHFTDCQIMEWFPEIFS